MDEEDKTSESLDMEREEMAWNEEIENLLKKYCVECEKVSLKHDIASKRKKKLYYSMSIPSIIIPLLMGFSNQFFGDTHEYSLYSNSYGYLLTGIVTGLSTFLNYGGKYIEHSVASNRYSEICFEIENLLVKKKRFRQAADLVLEKYKNKIEALNKYSISL